MDRDEMAVDVHLFVGLANRFEGVGKGQPLVDIVFIALPGFAEVGGGLV